MIDIDMNIVNAVDLNGVTLPPCPHIGIKLLKLRNDINLNIDRLVTTIELDPILTASILKVSRSNMYHKKANTEYCQNIKDAVKHVLGLDLSLNLALSLSVSSSLCKNTDVLLKSSYWFHSTAVALISKFIAYKFIDRSIISLDEAYLGGLLHDIGHIVLQNILGKNYILANDMSFRKKDELTFNEKELSLYTEVHSEVGKNLCNKWNLPSYLGFVCKYHHDESYSGAFSELIALVRLSENILSNFDYDNVESIISYPNCSNDLTILGIKEHQLLSNFPVFEMIVNDYRNSINSQL